MLLAIDSQLDDSRPVNALVALTASIAHEVNQPLSGIIVNASTCLRMLASSPPDVEGARKTALRAMRDANRATDVLARLRLLFAKEHVAPVAFDLNEAAHEVIARSVDELRAGQVRVLTAFAADLPPVMADRLQIQQVIQNLLSNAIDAMGDVQECERWVMVSTAAEVGGGVLLSVQDCGVGIAPADLNRISQAFYTTKPTGMGMGLFICNSIVQRHGGRLWAESTVGQGTTVSFFLP